ncbi:MAG: flavin reductase [Hyphomicrobiaceae bacterium]|nr:flavin reductase [Hyphomicrobiaceae bacterium]
MADGRTGADPVPALPPDRAALVYTWPPHGAFDGPAWRTTPDGAWRTRRMPETPAELAADSRWPALFPSALSIVTASDGETAAIEKVVGASIVNRFPYTLALSFCRTALSERHYQRGEFMRVVERSGHVAVQFLFPGPGLDRAMAAISSVPESDMAGRLAAAADQYHPALRSAAPVVDGAYLIYEGRFVEPGLDFDGVRVNEAPWVDCGSHRIYLFEIETISLAAEVARGERPIQWRSLPVWVPPAARPAASRPGPGQTAEARRVNRSAHLAGVGYQKTYRPDYVFPSASTIAFAGAISGSYAVLDVPPLPPGQSEVDNDQARWPCYFPSSLGMITTRAPDGTLAAFPCGSTAIVARSPLTFAICVSYGRINARYAPRASLDLLRQAGRFGCGMPNYDPAVLEAIAYLGNVSLRDDPDKVENCGLTLIERGAGFGFVELPVHFDCRIVEEVRLGTHSMFLGEVEAIFADARLDAANPVTWCPWAGSLPPAPASA